VTSTVETELLSTLTSGSRRGKPTRRYRTSGGAARGPERFRASGASLASVISCRFVICRSVGVCQAFADRPHQQEDPSMPTTQEIDDESGGPLAAAILEQLLEIERSLWTNDAEGYHERYSP
jgi:hypothetical protein